MFIDRYGTEAFEWHPQTIQMEISADFNVKLPKENFDKLLAGITVMTTPYFYTNLPKFIQLCNIFGGDDFDPEVFDPADSFEMSWAMSEVLMLDPPEERNPFSDEICAYIGEVLKEEGFITAPDVLKIGLKEDLSAQVATDFADDPEMFQAITETQAAKATDIEEALAENMRMLWIQLEAIPLKHGSTKDLLKRLQR